MRTLFVSLVFLTTLAIVPAMAQEDGGSNSVVQSAQSQSTPVVHRSIEGCLAYNGVSYVVAVVSNGPKQYRVVGGDIEALRGKLGHTVQISGVAGKNNPQEMVNSWDMREATTGVGWDTITAETVQDVTSNCSYPGFERSHQGAPAN